MGHMCICVLLCEEFFSSAAIASAVTRLRALAPSALPRVAETLAQRSRPVWTSSVCVVCGRAGRLKAAGEWVGRRAGGGWKVLLACASVRGLRRTGKCCTITCAIPLQTGWQVPSWKYPSNSIQRQKIYPGKNFHSFSWQTME